MSRTIAHFLEIPVVDLFSATFPYKPFSFSKKMIADLTSEISGVELPDTILGKQAEFIFELLLKQCKPFELLAANAQINGETQTIGELDYIVKNVITREFIHIELACKFYLFDDSNNEIFEGKWIGSNRKDTLLDKINKLKEKQFPLLYNSFTSNILNGLGIKVSEIIQQYYITSSFYIPQGFDVLKLPLEYQKCVVGTWIHFEDLILDEEYYYAMPSKKEWLLPPSEIVQWLTPGAIEIKISEEIKNRRAPQVYKKQGAQISKFFVVWWNVL
ncbi:MAG: DUF1853 family protein [Patiriisocius sp.]|uniref:DUF1853 family protein n=1 Tax=Patiriisocius sp. TaxID=2822396 RepID=UPI003EF6A76C